MRHLLESLLAIAIANINFANLSDNKNKIKNKLGSIDSSFKQNSSTKKVAIKVDNSQISPRFSIGEWITVKVQELDKQTNQIVSKKQVSEVKKIRVIIEVGNNQQGEVETATIQYLIAPASSNYSQSSTTVAPREIWVNEDNLII